MDEKEIEQLAHAVASKVKGSPWLESRSTGSARGIDRLSVRASTRPDVQASTRPHTVARRTPSRPHRVADYIDHSLLKAEATRSEIVKLCAEAKEHRFAAV